MKNGFTLIELLVIVAITSLLATMAIISIKENQKKSNGNIEDNDCYNTKILCIEECYNIYNKCNK